MSELKNIYNNQISSSYDKNKIVLLARDPLCLYAYWEISETTKNNFKNEFGEELWDKSSPFLKIVNVSKNTSTTIRINDFSNSWFINVANANALYIAELGRVATNQFFVNFASSNYISTPSNSISLNTGAYFIDYKDLRNGRLDLEYGQKNNTFEMQANINPKLGLSTKELFSINTNENFIGVSSSELFKGNLKLHLGVSSFMSSK